MTKQELRKAMRDAKALHSLDELKSLSGKICRTITSAPRWCNASTVLLYHPLPDEVDVSPLLDQGKEEGKMVLLPVVVGDDLLLREYEGEGTLHDGAYGIKEPTGYDFVNYATIDLVLVPGMAFDKDFHRLGRGKGYYDRLLPLLTNAHRLGVCFPFQLVDNVPSEVHDQSVDSLV